MRIDLVILVMLVSWVALGYGGSQLLQTHRSLNACTAQVKQIQQSLTTAQAETVRVNGDLAGCQSQLATTQDQLAGVENEYRRVNDILAGYITNNNILQAQVREYQEASGSCSTQPPVQEAKNDEPTDKRSPWIATLTLLLTGTAVAVKQLGTVMQKTIKPSNDYIQLTKEERQLIINLRRKQTHNWH